MGSGPKGFEGREAVMGVIVSMFKELARLGVSRAAAFFYAVAVGVVANVVIMHLAPHDGATTAPVAPPAIVDKPAVAPAATAVIAPKPAAPSLAPVTASVPAAMIRAPAPLVTP